MRSYPKKIGRKITNANNNYEEKWKFL